jgi:hypothetical protein
MGLTLVLVGLGLMLVVIVVRPLRKYVHGDIDSNGSLLR